MKDHQQPWVSNYPDLDRWLKLHNARCMSQTRIGGTASSPQRYIEFYLIGQRIFIVEVRSRGSGWNIYTDADTSSIAETLADADRRLGLTP